MNKHRLTHLRTTLQEVSESKYLSERFYLGVWGRVSPKAVDLEDYHDVKCEFAACAIGFACLTPSLRSEGLDFGVAEESPDFVFLTPIYAEKWGFDAVQEFFGLTNPQATWLFSPKSYKSFATPSMVLNRLDEFLGAGD